MIEISQAEFDNKIEQIIEGKTTRNKLIKELKIDRVTLNSRIQELIVKNPELYHKFVSKFPYMPREYTHINWRAMLIDIMKKGYTKVQAAEQYGIDSRTIARKVYLVEDEDEYIANLYREVARYRKHKWELPSNLKEIIDNLPEEEVFIGGIYDKKIEELMELESKYNEQLIEGKGATMASEECGKGRVSKNLKTLYRIEIEKNFRDNKGKTEQLEKVVKEQENEEER